jgi:hypothetical protein
VSGMYLRILGSFAKELFIYFTPMYNIVHIVPMNDVEELDSSAVTEVKQRS